MESLIFQYIWPACYEKDYDKQQGQIVTMIKELFVCHSVLIEPERQDRKPLFSRVLRGLRFITVPYLYL